MSIEIVKGNMNQLEEIVKANYQIFKGMYECEPYSLDDYQKKLSNKKPIVYLAKDKNKIIGDSISFERDGSFYIWIMGVLKKYQGRGIGTKLLDFNESYSKKKKFKSVTIKVYNVSLKMQKLLIKQGYKVIMEEVSKSNSINNAKHFCLKFT